ncbi:hypothetical protein [Kineococcus glutinatus]|uniref:Uncharacterized protein n=1 Tax=Kineococcus glutinatus TaxID=1070872 RepID=A0ABP9HX75_9ACTN
MNDTRVRIHLVTSAPVDEPDDGDDVVPLTSVVTRARGTHLDVTVSGAVDAPLAEELQLVLAEAREHCRRHAPATGCLPPSVHLDLQRAAALDATLERFRARLQAVVGGRGGVLTTHGPSEVLTGAR